MKKVIILLFLILNISYSSELYTKYEEIKNGYQIKYFNKNNNLNKIKMFNYNGGLVYIKNYKNNTLSEFIDIKNNTIELFDKNKNSIQKIYKI